MRDDQIQALVDMLLTRKDGGWQSANKADDSIASWKKRYNEIKGAMGGWYVTILLAMVTIRSNVTNIRAYWP